MTGASNLGPRVRVRCPAAVRVEARGREEIEPLRVGIRCSVPRRPAVFQFVERNH